VNVRFAESQRRQLLTRTAPAPIASGLPPATQPASGPCDVLESTFPAKLAVSTCDRSLCANVINYAIFFWKHAPAVQSEISTCCLANADRRHCAPLKECSESNQRRHAMCTHTRLSQSVLAGGQVGGQAVYPVRPARLPPHIRCHPLLTAACTSSARCQLLHVSHIRRHPLPAAACTSQERLRQLLTRTMASIWMSIDCGVLYGKAADHPARPARHGHITFGSLEACQVVDDTLCDDDLAHSLAVSHVQLPHLSRSRSRRGPARRAAPRRRRRPPPGQRSAPRPAPNSPTPRPAAQRRCSPSAPALKESISIMQHYIILRSSQDFHVVCGALRPAVPRASQQRRIGARRQRLR